MCRMHIEVTPGFALLLAFLICLDPSNITLFFLIGAALHELGHLLSMKLLGIVVYRLQIGLTGAILSTGMMVRTQEWKVAAAGPLVNLFCCVLTWGFSPKFAWVSLFLACFNLLPVWPLDGGRILLACCPVHGAQISEFLSFSLVLCGCVLTVVLHMGLWPLLILAVLLIKILLNRRQEEKLIANNASGRYNI